MTKATSGASKASGPPWAPLRNAARNANAVIIPINAGPFLAMLATACADASVSLIELLIHSTVPPPNRATR